MPETARQSWSGEPTLREPKMPVLTFTACALVDMVKSYTIAAPMSKKSHPFFGIILYARTYFNARATRGRVPVPLSPAPRSPFSLTAPRSKLPAHRRSDIRKYPQGANRVCRYSLGAIIKA